MRRAVLGIRTVVLLVGDHEEVIIAAMLALSVVVFNLPFGVVVAPVGSCIGVEGFGPLKMVRHDLSVVLEGDLAAINVNKVLCKPVLPQELGHVLALLH